jgi:hypothetical protein
MISFVPMGTGTCAAELTAMVESIDQYRGIPQYVFPARYRGEGWLVVGVSLKKETVAKDLNAGTAPDWKY